MEADFWHERWRHNRIGFHGNAPLPLLKKHWPSLGLAPDTRVFVPLCGKSLDMVWLAEQGHRVLGIDLSPLAVEQFFAERGLSPEITHGEAGIHYTAGPYELVVGDAFAIPSALLADCAGVYDRAALVALPPDMRATYVDTAWQRLRTDCRGLLLTLEYAQAERGGPPFSVGEAEVRERFKPDWSIELLERRDILESEPAFQADGVSALDTAAYRMQRTK